MFKISQFYQKQYSSNTIKSGKYWLLPGSVWDFFKETGFLFTSTPRLLAENLIFITAY